MVARAVALALWLVPLVSIEVFLYFMMSKSPHKSQLVVCGGNAALVIGVLLLYLCVCQLLELHKRDRDDNDSVAVREYRATRISVTENHLSPNLVASQREQYSRGTRLVMSHFCQSAQIARLVRLPPVKSFAGEEETAAGSRRAGCTICMEVFKKGELVQPFGICVHEFHSSCLNSWLHGGKTTCPLCRRDLANSQYPC